MGVDGGENAELDEMRNFNFEETASNYNGVVRQENGKLTTKRVSGGEIVLYAVMDDDDEA